MCHSCDALRVQSKPTLGRDISSPAKIAQLADATLVHCRALSLLCQCMKASNTLWAAASVGSIDDDGVDFVQGCQSAGVSQALVGTGTFADH